jgi:hypothetical protein
MNGTSELTKIIGRWFLMSEKINLNGGSFKDSVGALLVAISTGLLSNAKGVSVKDKDVQECCRRCLGHLNHLLTRGYRPEAITIGMVHGAINAWTMSRKN